jgi:glutamyl-tRNA reductase
MSLTILDRPRGHGDPPDSTLVWQTCLREVVFTDDDAEPWARGGEALRDADAYGRLLEIICGLRSPLVGETQVLGQFKAFLAALRPEQRWFTAIGQRLLTDARAIRARHLHHLGQRTYGSAVRSCTAGCSTVALIGSGALADEILPFISGDARSVHQWTRRPAGLQRGSSVTHRLIAAWRDAAVDESAAAAVVVAAPVPDADLQHVASRYAHVHCVVDLRADSARLAWSSGVRVITLGDLFAQMAAHQLAGGRAVAAARAEILVRSRDFHRAELLRPFGWDDLCA